jgi:hypothetical protein
MVMLAAAGARTTAATRPPTGSRSATATGAAAGARSGSGSRAASRPAPRTAPRPGAGSPTSGAGHTQGRRNCRADGRAKPSARVPSGRGRESAIVARGYVMEGAGRGVEGGVHKS